MRKRINPSELVGLTDAAKLYGCSRTLIARFARRGDLAYVTIGRTRAFRKVDVVALRKAMLKRGTGRPRKAKEK